MEQPNSPPPRIIHSIIIENEHGLVEQQLFTSHKNLSCTIDVDSIPSIDPELMEYLSIVLTNLGIHFNPIINSSVMYVTAFPEHELPHYF
jgi:hypothetical protein